MLSPFLMRSWLRLPSRIALLLGLGALSAAGVKVDAGEAGPGHGPARVPQQSVKTFGDLLIWNEGGRIYVAEAGKEAQELALGDYPETHRLRQLLERDGATAASPRALRDRIILVGGGGDGFHWGPVRQSDGREKPSRSTTLAVGKLPDPRLTPPPAPAAATQRPRVHARH